MTVISIPPGGREILVMMKAIKFLIPQIGIRDDITTKPTSFRK